MYKTILQSIVGSTVHGMAVSDGLEDLDLMSVVIEDADTFVGTCREQEGMYIWEQRDSWLHRSKPEGVRSEAGDIDHVLYGLRKYMKLLLKSNPSVIIPLFAPPEMLKVCTSEGRELRALALSVMSKRAHASFKGYMHQQHQRLLGTAGQKNCTRPELIERYGYDTKYAGHIVRLGFQGVELLMHGRLTLPLPERERAFCIEVRTGKYTLEQVSQEITQLEHQLDIAHTLSPLRDEPDIALVQAWVVDKYHAHWAGVPVLAQHDYR